MAKRAAQLLVLLVVLVACTDAAPESSSAPTTPARPEPSPSPTAAEVAPTPSATATTPTESPSPTSAPASELADLLVPGVLLAASDQGVDVVPPDGDPVAVTTIPAVAAYYDGAGGVVFQGIAPPQQDAPSAAIMWLPPDGSDAVTVVPDGDADFVTLRDAGYIDGQPTAVYTITTDSTSPPDAVQQLVIRALPDGEPTEIAAVGNFESGVQSASYGEGTVALNQFSEATSWFAFLEADGEPIELQANPLPEDDACLDSADCPSTVAIAQDGKMLAWIKGNEVLTAPLDGEPQRLTQLPSTEPGVAYTSLDLTSELLVVNRALITDGPTAFPAYAPPLVVDLSSSNPEPVEAELAAFTSVVGG